MLTSTLDKKCEMTYAKLAWCDLKISVCAQVALEHSYCGKTLPTYVCARMSGVKGIAGGKVDFPMYGRVTACDACYALRLYVSV